MWLQLRKVVFWIFLLGIATALTTAIGFILLRLFVETSGIAKILSMLVVPGLFVTAIFYGDANDFDFYFVVSGIQFLYCLLWMIVIAIWMNRRKRSRTKEISFD